MYFICQLNSDGIDFPDRSGKDDFSRFFIAQNVPLLFIGFEEALKP